MSLKSSESKDQLPRIALIGPVAPFRGGIAQYTTQLHNALSECSDLQTISFKRLYPSWLYPGKSDKEAGEQKNLSGIDYLIDVYSPLSVKKAADKIIESGCDLAIISWWTLFWQPGLAYVARRLRKHGVKTAFLCHNLFDHDSKGVARKFSEIMLRQANAYIVHTGELRDLFKEIKPSADVLQRLHPIYNHFPNAQEKLPKRGRLELLFFGFVRPYKGLDVLVKALAELKDERVHLTVVGEPWGDAEELKTKLENSGAPNLELHLDYVNDKTAANYFERADAVVLPYLTATGSGVVTLAYHYRKPVIATKVGGLTEAVIEGQTGWLVKPNSSRQLAEVIGNLDRKKLVALEGGIKRFCDDNSWAGMAQAICEFANKPKQGQS